MQLTSGLTTQYVYFVAVDATDLKTRETGLTGFTVYRSRNGGSLTAYTTPTISELSSSNAPGVYALLCDEDTTITSGAMEEQYCLQIAHASMAPVTLVATIKRAIVTAGQTLTVTAGVGTANATQIGGQTASASGTVTFPNATLASTTNITAGTITTATNVTTVNGLASSVITATSIASNAITSAKIAADAIGASQIADNAIDAGAIASSAITSAKFAAGAITSTVIAADAIGASQIATDAIGSAELAASAVTKIQAGLSTLDAAGVRSAVGLASANLDTQLAALPTATENATEVFSYAFPASAGALTFEELTSLIAYANLAKVSGMDVNAPVFRNIADSGNTITATTDASGNRLSVVLTP